MNDSSDQSASCLEDLLPFPKLHSLLDEPYLLTAFSFGYKGQQIGPFSYPLTVKYSCNNGTLADSYPIHLMWGSFTNICVDSAVHSLWESAGEERYGFTGHGAIVLQCKPPESEADFSTASHRALVLWVAEAVHKMLGIEEAINSVLEVDEEITILEDGVMFHYLLHVPCSEDDWNRGMNYIGLISRGAAMCRESFIVKDLKEEALAESPGPQITPRYGPSGLH